MAKCSRRRGGILKEDVVFLCRKTFGEGEGFTVHTLRRECAAFVYFRCLSPLQHILHISTCTCTCACAYVHAVRCLHNPDYDRYLSASLRYVSPLPIIYQNMCPLVNTPLDSNKFYLFLNVTARNTQPWWLSINQGTTKPWWSLGPRLIALVAPPRHPPRPKAGPRLGPRLGVL